MYLQTECLLLRVSSITVNTHVEIIAQFNYCDLISKWYNKKSNFMKKIDCIVGKKTNGERSHNKVERGFTKRVQEQRIVCGIHCLSDITNISFRTKIESTYILTLHVTLSFTFTKCYSLGSGPVFEWVSERVRVLRRRSFIKWVSVGPGICFLRWIVHIIIM